MAKRKKQIVTNQAKDLIDCPGESYLIERRVCEARRRRTYKHCSRCPENSDQLSLFESPRQVIQPKRRKTRREDGE
ncbi:MAG: hypothetical protein ABIF71_01845 [Planctomycetota bacterium]